MRAIVRCVRCEPTATAQLALIRSGCGIGVCQVAIAKRDPSLMRVLLKQFELKLETWVTLHEDLRNRPRCKVTFDALVRGLTATRQP